MSDNSSYNSIPASHADMLISAHDGDVALLYIYISRHGRYERESAAKELCRTLGEISSAEEKLSRMGLFLSGKSSPAPAPAVSTGLVPDDSLPEYSAEYISRRSQEDDSFSVIVSEATRVVGHALSGSDLKKLFGIYDFLALPPEVILELLNYCADICRGSSGQERRPGMRFIVREAYSWVNREIMTLELAEEYIRSQKTKLEDTDKIKNAVGIKGRELSATEKRYISSWLDMGYDLDCILIAYDRTVTNTGSLKWSYMDKIIQNWQKAGLRNAAEIEKADSKFRKNVPPSASSAAKPIDIDKLNEILGKI